MKTCISLLATAIGLSLFISSCYLTGPDWDRINNGVNSPGYSFGTGGPPLGNFLFRILECKVDSAGARRDSSLTIFAHFIYDTTLVFDKLGVNYWEDNYPAPVDSVYQRFWPVPDTVAFKALTDSIPGSKNRRYKLKMKIDGLKRNKYYRFCVYGEYLDKGSKKGAGQCASFITH